MLNHRINKFIKNPKKALITLSIPIVAGMLVQVLYNIVDTAFVGRLGAEAIAALTFAFPVFFILMGINAGISTGMASRISRYMGEKKKKAAENTAIHGLLLSITSAVVIVIIGFFTMESLFLLMGAEGNVLSLTMDYMRIILISIIFMFPAFTINSIFSAQGDTKTPMKVQISALGLNIILDPIFIYVFEYGVKGAAIATAISFFVALVMYVFYLKRKSLLHVKMSSFNFSKSIVKEIFFVGIPASIMMLLMSVYMSFINGLMANFGVEYVAAFGLSIRLDSVAVMPIMAISIAAMTLAGMFYGAKRYDLLKGINWFAVKVAMTFGLFMGTLFFLFPSVFLRIFTADPTLIDLSSSYVKIMVFSFPLMSIGMITSRTLQGMGYGMPALIMGIIRIVLIGIPLPFILVFMFGYGYLSVPFALVLGGIASSAVAASMFIFKIRKLNPSR